MTILTEGNDSLFITTQATLIEDDRDTAAWASKYIVSNKNIKWVLGKYVEADNANSNGQYWQYDDLRMSQPTISHSPMNIDHHAQEIVGTWVASEMMHPTDQDSVINPYIETLGAFWKFYFPDTLKKVEAAYNTGGLFISMECVSESITCAGDNGCGETFDYAGPNSQSYCSHIKDRASFRQLNNPSFLGGALIVPPNKPGWSNAEVKEISKMTSDETKNKILVEIAKEMPHATPSEWEKTMWAIQMQALTSR